MSGDWPSSAKPPSNQTFLVPPDLLALIVLGAYAVGLGLAPALPGTAVGFGHWIEGVRLVAAWLAQLSALTFAFLAASLLMALTQQRAPLLLRSWLVLAGCLVMAAVMLSASGLLTLHPVWFSALVVVSSTSAAAAAVLGIRNKSLRGPSLILAATSAAGLVHGVARLWGAASGSNADLAGYAGARALSTVGWGLELIALALAAFWLLAGRQTALLRGLSLLALTLCSALSWNLSPDSKWLALVQRSAAQLSLAPEPLASAFLRAVGNIAPIVLCVLLFAARQRNASQRLVVVLALVSRAKADSPLGALFDVTAALILVSLALEGSQAAAPEGLSPREPM